MVIFYQFDVSLCFSHVFFPHSSEAEVPKSPIFDHHQISNLFMRRTHLELTLTLNHHVSPTKITDFHGEISLFAHAF
jgi:hypothetical protein